MNEAPLGGQVIIDACGGVAFGNGFKCCLEVGVWLNVVELAGLNE